MTTEALDELRLELSSKMRNGAAFIIGGCIVWLATAIVWFFDTGAAYNNISFSNIYTLVLAGMVSFAAFILSKILKIPYSVPENPLGILGLLLNLASLFFIPFNVILLIKAPEYLLASLATITGAHFFPYAWFYKTKSYAVFAGIIVVGVFLLRLFLPNNKIVILPLFMFIALALLSIILLIESGKKHGYHSNT